MVNRGEENVRVYINVVPSSTMKYKWWNRELTLRRKSKFRKPHEVKKTSFDLGGNRTHDLRIRSTVTLPTEQRGRTENVGRTILDGESRRESKSTISTLIYTAELILCSTICVHSATRRNIHML